MSNIRLQGNPSGTGTLTIASPNTNSDFTLNLPASGGTVLLDGATQSPTFNAVTATSVATTSATTTTLAVNGNNISAVNSLGFRNRIINGDMRIDQRNAGAAVTVNTALVVYTVDRLYSFVLGAACTAQRISSGRTDFPSALRVTGAASNTYVEVGQRIESFNCTDLVGGSVTVSFLAARSSGTSVTVRLSYANTTDGHISGVTTIGTQVVTISSTLAQYTVTFNSLPSQTANGLQIGFEFGAVGSGQNVTITGVQLEAGSVATPFERRDYGRELMMCQRYFEKSYNTDVSIGTNTTVSMSGGAAIYYAPNSTFYMNSVFYKVTKRATPSVSVWSYTGVSGQWHYGVVGASEALAPVVILDSGATSFRPYQTSVPSGQNNMYGQWAATSEL